MRNFCYYIFQSGPSMLPGNPYTDLWLIIPSKVCKRVPVSLTLISGPTFLTTGDLTSPLVRHSWVVCTSPQLPSPIPWFLSPFLFLSCGKGKYLRPLFSNGTVLDVHLFTSCINASQTSAWNGFTKGLVDSWAPVQSGSSVNSDEDGLPDRLSLPPWMILAPHVANDSQVCTFSPNITPEAKIHTSQWPPCLRYLTATLNWTLKSNSSFYPLDLLLLQCHIPQ